MLRCAVGTHPTEVLRLRPSSPYPQLPAQSVLCTLGGPSSTANPLRGSRSLFFFLFLAFSYKRFSVAISACLYLTGAPKRCADGALSFANVWQASTEAKRICTVQKCSGGELKFSPRPAAQRGTMPQRASAAYRQNQSSPSFYVFSAVPVVGKYPPGC